MSVTSKRLIGRVEASLLANRIGELRYNRRGNKLKFLLLNFLEFQVWVEQQLKAPLKLMSLRQNVRIALSRSRSRHTVS